MKKFLITHPFYKKILLAAIWLILVCGIVIVLKKEVSPVIAIDSLTVSYPDTTLEILPDATIEEDIAWDRSTLESIDLAFSYTDDVWQDTQVKVSVFRDDAVIIVWTEKNKTAVFYARCTIFNLILFIRVLSVSPGCCSLVLP